MQASRDYRQMDMFERREIGPLRDPPIPEKAEKKT